MPTTLYCAALGEGSARAFGDLKTCEEAQGSVQVFVKQTKVLLR